MSEGKIEARRRKGGTRCEPPKGNSRVALPDSDPMTEQPPYDPSASPRPAQQRPARAHLRLRGIPRDGEAPPPPPASRLPPAARAASACGSTRSAARHVPCGPGRPSSPSLRCTRGWERERGWRRARRSGPSTAGAWGGRGRLPDVAGVWPGDPRASGAGLAPWRGRAEACSWLKRTVALAAGSVKFCRQPWVRVWPLACPRPSKLFEQGLQQAAGGPGCRSRRDFKLFSRGCGC